MSAMEDVDLRHAKEHLEDLMERAKRGEDVRISDPVIGTVRLTAVGGAPPVKSHRVIDTMEPFVPLKEKRKLGRLKGKIPPPPDDFFDPMTEEELRDWYGEDA
jgi:antitoxin (DNA-binding transcriptional repressor) of toxin-antitoxin stability system